MHLSWCFFFFQAEDGIRDLVRSRGLGDVYKRQAHRHQAELVFVLQQAHEFKRALARAKVQREDPAACLLYTSDAADERSSVDLGGRRIIKNKNNMTHGATNTSTENTLRR